MVYAGFHDSRRDIPDPPPAQTAPDQHDEENMDARPESPDQEEMEQANNKFPACSGWGAREEGLQGIGSPAVTLAQDCTRVCLPLRSMSVAEAMEGSFLPALDKEQTYMFTPSELRLYQHAQDHRLLSRDILGYPSLFGNIHGLSTRQFLSCCSSRIAPHNRMKVTFLVYADNTVYQILLKVTVQIRGLAWSPSVAAVPGSAHRFRRNASLSGSLRLFEFQYEAHRKSLAEKI